MTAEGKRWKYLDDIDIQAQQMFDTLVKQMKVAEGVTEQPKEVNHFEWVCMMNNIITRASESVCKELIYA